MARAAMLTEWMFLALFCQPAARAALLPSYEAISSDEVSLVQLKSVGGAEFQQEFKLEDAEPLFNLAYQVAHNDSIPTLEEKAISLLQNLAQQRRVVGTSAQKALLKTAAVAKQMLDSGRLESDLEEELGEESNASRKSFDWVHIVDEESQETGYCWHVNGGKPIMCKPNEDKLGNIRTWQYDGYDNPCEWKCAQKGWCSGYGWIPEMQEDQEAECVLFNDGSYDCTRKGFFWTEGIAPVLSASDLVLEANVAGQTKKTRFPKTGAPAKVRYARIGEYKCVAKYKEPQKSSWLFGSDAKWKVIDANAKCQHALTTQQTNVYLRECGVNPHQLAFLRLEADDNSCKKLCAGLKWCSGYAYRKPRKISGLDVWEEEECSHYTKDQCPSRGTYPYGDGWKEITKDHPAGKTFLSPRAPAKISKHFVPDVETKNAGWECVAKEYNAFLEIKSGAGRKCYSDRGGTPVTAAMAISAAAGVLSCPSMTASSRRASPKRSNVTLEDGIPTLVAPPNLTELLAFAGGIVENFTDSDARSALAHYSKDTKEDADAIEALRRKRSADNVQCYVMHSGQAMRFIMYMIASYVGGQGYSCTLMNKAKSYCTTNSLRAVGAGVFGAGMYGVPRILQECGSNPWPVTRLSCGIDFSKASMYLGRAIWKFIQLVWLSDKDATRLENGALITEILSSLVFVAEGILRTQGPCLGELSGNPNKVNLENGACIATATEVAALGLQSLAFGGSAIANCRKSKKTAIP